MTPGITGGCFWVKVVNFVVAYQCTSACYKQSSRHPERCNYYNPEQRICMSYVWRSYLRAALVRPRNLVPPMDIYLNLWNRQSGFVSTFSDEGLTRISSLHDMIWIPWCQVDLLSSISFVWVPAVEGAFGPSWVGVLGSRDGTARHLYNIAQWGSKKLRLTHHDVESAADNVHGANTMEHIGRWGWMYFRVAGWLLWSAASDECEESFEEIHLGVVFVGHVIGRIIYRRIIAKWGIWQLFPGVVERFTKGRNESYEEGLQYW